MKEIITRELAAHVRDKLTGPICGIQIAIQKLERSLGLLYKMANEVKGEIEALVAESEKEGFAKEKPEQDFIKESVRPVLTADR